MFLTRKVLTVFSILVTLAASSDDAEWVTDVSGTHIENLPKAEALVNGEHSDLGKVLSLSRACPHVL